MSACQEQCIAVQREWLYQTKISTVAASPGRMSCAEFSPPPLLFAWAISVLFSLHTLFWRSGYPISHRDSPTLQINVICLLTAEYQIPPWKVTDPQHAWKTCKYRHFLTALDSFPMQNLPECISSFKTTLLPATAHFYKTWDNWAETIDLVSHEL